MHEKSVCCMPSHCVFYDSYVVFSTDFYEEVVRYIDNGQMYAETVEPLNSPSLITAFIPTDEAIQKVPPEKLGELRSNPERLNEVSHSSVFIIIIIIVACADSILCLL